MVNKDDSTEARILMAARKVFIEKGMDGARMQDIADEARINKALLHYYFRSKEKLFEVIFKETVSEFMPKIVQIFDSDAGLFDKIEMFCREYIGQMQKTPFLPIFVLHEVNRQPETFIQKLWGRQKPPVHKLLGQIEEAVRAGEIRPLNPVDLLLNILSMCIFPFVARPIIQVTGPIEQEAFDGLMEARKKSVAQFIIESIKQ